MKVNDTSGSNVIPKKISQPEALVGTGGAGGADGPGGAGRGDKAEFVHEKIMEAIRSEPEIRTELVEKYKQLIKSGEYRMEPEELASRMVEDSFSESILRSKT
mgnify:CR=1 FL=1|jgi:hypothetical protein